jgi:cbb3-type cytochrome oxidase subunit 3
MLNMTPFQSWTTLVLLLVLVGLVIWLLRILEEQRIERADAARNAAADSSITNTERHLTLVPELPRVSQKLYDWAQDEN